MTLSSHQSGDDRVEAPAEDDTNAVEGRELDDIPTATAPSAGPRRRGVGWIAARLLGWLAATLLLTLDRRDDLATYIPGDTGDSYLILSLLQWGGDHVTRGFIGFWDGPMFFDTPNVMAYSDTFLGLAVPFKLVETVTGSPVIAFNVLYIAAWVLCAEATYALARRLIGNPWIAWAAAAAFTFSTIRITGSNHFQLMWAGLIPLTFLALCRFREDPTIGRALAVGGAVLGQMLTSAYYGVILLVVTGVAMTFLAVRAAVTTRSVVSVRSHLVFFAFVGLPMLFLQLKYSAAAETHAGRPEYPAPFATRLGDFRSPPPTTRLLDSIPFLDDTSSMRSPENHAYVGAFVLVGMLVLLVLAVTRPSEVMARLRASAFGWTTIVGTGILGVAIAFGRNQILGVENPFYDLARSLIPGVSSMLAIGRLVVFTQLALVLIAALAITIVAERIGRRVLAPAASIVFVLVVALEGLMQHPMIYVVRPEPGSVNAYLEERGDGTVALLPMAPTSAGIMHPFTEGPRLVLGADDQLRSVNGYSGYVPADYDETVAALNEFPAPPSLDAIAELGLGTVVIYTRGVDLPGTDLDDVVNGAGWAYLPIDEARRRIAAAPPGLIVDSFEGVDGIVLVLDPTVLRGS